MARWRGTRSKWGKVTSKIPTQVAYDPEESDGPIVAWGKECDDLPFGQVKQCFKAFIGDATFPIAPSTMAVPGGPISQKELHRWVRDYLRAFCMSVVELIDREMEDRTWRSTATWNFTVPGAWPSFPVVADFKRVAEEAVFSFFEESKDVRIFANLTEGKASAMFLMVNDSANKANRYTTGNMVISCDIGGATTDIAVSIVSSAGRLEHWPQLRVEPTGIVTIEKQFYIHACQALKEANVQSAADVALTMARSREFARVRASFSRLQSEQLVRIPLPSSCEVRDWSPSGSSSSQPLFIKNSNLCIPK